MSKVHITVKFLIQSLAKRVHCQILLMSSVCSLERVNLYFNFEVLTLIVNEYSSFRNISNLSSTIFCIYLQFNSKELNILKAGVVHN